MLFNFVDAQKQFRWMTTASGLPVGDVLHLGTGRWLMVCPCCGMAHDVTSIQSDTYALKCLVKATHPTVYAKWVKQYPDAA